MAVAARTLAWHDAGVKALHTDGPSGCLVWDVEVLRWDLSDDGDAQPGQVVFEDVEQMRAVCDLESVSLEGKLRGHFLLALPRSGNERQGLGSGELVGQCGAARFLPSPEGRPDGALPST